MRFFNKKKFQMLKEKENTKTHTIMIVEDKKANLKSLASLLAGEYNVITARNGQEALEYIQTMEHPGKLSLIVSDQRMPNLTGVELFEHLISAPLKYKFPNTIRIIVTGFVDFPVILDAINKVKIYEFILKPFEPDDFLLRVKRAVEAFDRQQALDECCRDHQEVKARVRELEIKNKELEKKLETLLKNDNSMPLSSDDLTNKED